MLKPHYIILLVSLMSDGGTVAPVPRPAVLDAGTDAGLSVLPGLDAGVDAGPASSARADAGTHTLRPIIAGDVRWPDEVKTLTTLDGPAILAAHAALQALLARFAKEGVSGCGYSAKGLELTVGEGGGMYIVRIDQRMDKCGWKVPPGFSTEMDWFELYAVSPEGKVLARYPFAP
jgi:hypothetical protein